jgi:hypothetical protein
MPYHLFWRKQQSGATCGHNTSLLDKTDDLIKDENFHLCHPIGCLVGVEHNAEMIHPVWEQGKPATAWRK